MKRRFRFSRLHLAWRVLLGKPLVYKAWFDVADGPIHFPEVHNRDLYVVNCIFWGKPEL